MGSNRTRLGALLIAVLALGSVAATTAWPAERALNYGSCVANRGLWGCANPARDSLGIAYDVAVSPDGRNVYVAASERSLPSIVGNSVTTFERAPGGRLRQLGCIANPAPRFSTRDPRGCVSLPHESLAGAQDLAISPDGRSIYALTPGGEGNPGAITVLNRSADGTLTPLGCISYASAEGCTEVSHHQAHSRPTDLAISPDGSSVYVTSSGSSEQGNLVSGSITQFSRAADGTLSEVECISSAGESGCAAAAVSSLLGASQVAISPDGRSLYVLSSGTTTSAKLAIAEFGRAADGRLAVTGCFGPAAGCSPPSKNWLSAANGIAISPDGASVYALSTSAIGVLSRAADGSLVETGCITIHGNRFRKPVPGCTGMRRNTLSGGQIAISPDGAFVYVTNGSGVAAFARTPNGALTESACISDAGRRGRPFVPRCVKSRHNSLGGASGLAVSPDGLSVYVASFIANSVTELRRGPPGEAP